MKAIIYNNYGDYNVLQYKETETPKIKSDEVLVKIHSVSVSSGDQKLRSANPFMVRLFNGITKPKNTILGSSYSGEIVLVGQDNTQFNVGDEVFGYSLFGAYSEYKLVGSKELLIKKPENISHNEAASVPFGALTAKYFLNQVNIIKSNKVLLIGASGNVGIYALQLLKNKTDIITVVSSENSFEDLLELGAQKFINYKTDKLNKYSEKYDLIFDVSGKYTYSDLKGLLNKSGTFITTNFNLSTVFTNMKLKLIKTHRYIFGMVHENLNDFNEISRMLNDGRLKTIISKEFELKDAALAHKYAEGKSKTGVIVLNVVK